MHLKKYASVRHVAPIYNGAASATYRIIINLKSWSPSLPIDNACHSLSGVAHGS